MDCIPGLDGDELMIIMTGAFEQALKEGIEKKKKADREKLLEAVAEFNETLMEKYFEDPESLTEREILEASSRSNYI